MQSVGSRFAPSSTWLNRAEWSRSCRTCVYSSTGAESSCIEHNPKMATCRTNNFHCIIHAVQEVRAKRGQRPVLIVTSISTLYGMLSVLARGLTNHPRHTRSTSSSANTASATCSLQTRRIILDPDYRTPLDPLIICNANAAIGCFKSSLVQNT